MWENLAPEICRQRAIIEGKPKFPITDEHIKEYLSRLSKEIGMKTLIEPITHYSDKFGWAGWIHWEISGCHFYAWEKPFLFFSVDIYTCKEFDVEKAVDFTKRFFDPEELVFRDI